MPEPPKHPHQEPLDALTDAGVPALVVPGHYRDRDVQHAQAEKERRQRSKVTPKATGSRRISGPKERNSL